MREGFGGLMQAALAFRLDMGEVIRRGVTDPRWLRDKLTPWYARHFMAVRRMAPEERERLLTQVNALARLLKDYEDWLGGIIATLPGFGLYNTMLLLIQGDYQQAASVGASTMLTFGAIALALGCSTVVFRKLRHFRSASRRPGDLR